jgi:hypothetical protein
MVNSVTTHLTETKTLADAVSLGYAVVREVDEGGEVDPENRAALGEYRTWCKAKEVPCVEVYQFHGDPNWDVCVDFPASSPLFDEVEEIIHRYGGSPEVEEGRVSTTSYLPEQDAFDAATELADLVEQSVQD